jgi:hypothetical protein
MPRSRRRLVSELIGAQRGERTEDRATHRNGYRPRRVDRPLHPVGKTIAQITIKDIEVMAIGAATARIAVDAPAQVAILRGELLDG